MTHLSYEQFGQAFVHRVITPERIRRELLKLLAQPIEGAIAVLPAELISAQYTFKLDDVQVSPLPARLPLLALRQHITGTLALAVRILGMPFRFTLRIGIRIEQQVHTRAPLVVHLDTPPIDAASVDIAVDAHGLPSEILDRLQIIDRAVRAEVVAQVNRRLRSGPVAAALTIDVQRLADNARLSRVVALHPAEDETPAAKPLSSGSAG